MQASKSRIGFSVCTGAVRIVLTRIFTVPDNIGLRLSLLTFLREMSAFFVA